MRTEDGHLVSKCLSGEPETFGLLVDKYKSAIYGFAYARLGDFQDAEDLTQEVFLRAYQKLHNLKHYDSFLSWLYAIASNLCKKLLNAKARRVDQQYLEDQQESVWNLPSLETYHRKQKYQSLYEALAELPEIYRQVLTLYYLGGMNTREIARFFGTSKNTIESRLRRARAKLKEEMITMMRTTFDEMKLQPGFTFRVVEALKQTKIQTAPYKTALPYGVSAAAMMIALLFALTVPYSPFYPIGQWIGSTLPSKTQVVEDGVIPVDTMDVTKITILTSENEDGDFGQKPQPERARMFASAGGKWEKRADMPKGRAFLSGAALDGEIYAVGGFGDFPEMVGTMEAYDPKTDTWEKRANMPTSRSGHAVVALNRKLYAIGGFNNPATFEFKLDKKFYGDLESERISAGLRQVFLAHGITPSKISIRRWGGWRITDIENHRTYGVREEGGELNVYSNVSPARVEVYDPSTDMWTRKADLPTPRSSLAAVALDGKIYTIGGARGGGLVKTVEVYDPGTDTWTKKARLVATERTARRLRGEWKNLRFWGATWG